MKAKVKRIVVKPEVLFEIMSPGSCWRTVKGVPKGSKLKGFTIDPYTQDLVLFVENEKFEAVDIGQIVPKQELLVGKILTLEQHEKSITHQP